MARPNLLTENELANELASLDLWSREGNRINRELVASNFVSALGIVNAIGILSEVADHHPDILIYGWNKIRVTLSTHDCGGLTRLDIDLAKEIDNLKF